MARNRIETLIQKGRWDAAERAALRELANDPDDHWLWSQLSAAKYEQRDYRAALEAADKAVAIVPDCPLALWGRAGALEMLDQPKDAGLIYLGLLRRGREELKEPDEDADECWEGEDWTRGLVIDCMFRVAGCLSAMGRRGLAAEWYKRFLEFLDFGFAVQPGIYTREDAITRVKKLGPSGATIPAPMDRRIKELEAALA